MAPSWHEQSDQAVEQGLKLKLEELKAADLFARLGVAPAAETAAIRAAFLSATKIFHPSRFARRPAPTRQLANEVFLLIKAAYVELSSGTHRMRTLGTGASRAVTGDALSASRGPTNSTSSRRATTSDPAAPAASTATGRTPVVKMTASPSGSRGRASTAPVENGAGTQRAVSSSREREERFAAAVAMVSHGAYGEACTELKGLADANPNLTKFRVYLHYARGRQLAEAGEHDQARVEYQASLALHPQFFLATKALGQLPGAPGDSPLHGEQEPPEPPAGKRGLFSRLFRK